MSVALELATLGLLDDPDESVRNPLTAFDWYGAAWAEDPLWTPPSVAYTSADGLVLPGTAGNYASVPDEAALDITGDITLVARVALDDWTPAADSTVLAKWTASGSQQSFALFVTTTGVLRLNWSTTGGNNISAVSTVAPTVANGATLWIAVSFDVDDGGGNRVTKFWTSADGVTWVQLGSTVTTAGATSVYASTAVCEFGTINVGTSNPLDGNLSVARVYSGSGFTTSGPSGSLVLDADFRRARTSSFTAATGQTVTINSGAAVSSWRNGGTLGTAFEQSTGASQPTFRGSLAVFNNRPAVDFDGTDDRLEITSGVSLAQPFSVVWVGVVDNYATNGALVGFNSAATARRVFCASSSGNKFGLNATTNSFSTATYSTGTGYMTRTLVSGASSSLSVNGTADTLSADPGATAVDQLILGAGRAAPSTYGNHFDGKTAFVGIIAGDISTHPNWPAFKRWVALTYGITVA